MDSRTPHRWWSDHPQGPTNHYYYFLVWALGVTGPPSMAIGGFGHPKPACSANGGGLATPYRLANHLLVFLIILKI